MYEGYGPGGVAVLVECATDNTNRTYPFVKTAFAKHGGRIADKGSVAYLFDRKGVITVKGEGEDLLLQVLDAGAEDATQEDGITTVYTIDSDLAKVRDKLKDDGLEVKEAEISYIPQNTVEVTDEATQDKIERLMDAIEDLDDVTNTHVNFEFPE